MILQAINVHKSYRHGATEVGAVRDVSVTINAGETVAIVGPSGSGKSTLLNLLGGLDRPDSGEVLIDGTGLSGFDDDGLTRLRRAKVGLVFQFFNLLRQLNARENVALPLQLAGMAHAEAERRADELLAQMGLGARTHHRPDEMSGGEMQRVAVARALGPRPAVLLADEPTGNLDSASGEAVLGMLLDAASQHSCAVVLITHDPRAARRADRIIEFKDGKIVSDSTQRASLTVSVGAPSRESSQACGT
jgi:putative ABC transport system ATP-binding protein